MPQLNDVDRAENAADEIAQLRQMQDAILIAGATGMLAVGLIKALLERTSRPLILCVRGETHALARRRVLSAIFNSASGCNSSCAGSNPNTISA